MFNFDNPYYYDILEVDETASQEEIIASFRRLAKGYHPDNRSFQSTSQKQGRERGDCGENKQGLHNTVNKKRITGISEETYINGKLQ